MLVLFRTDASIDIGTGHVMRCLTLAEALRDKGAKCRFVCRELAGNLVAQIGERGFEALVLPLVSSEENSPDDNAELAPQHAGWLGTGWQTDADETLALIGAERVDWLIVDHYALEARWETQLRAVCDRLMVIDDLADRRHDCDLLLDQNLGQTTALYEGLVPRGAKMLVGPEFALLRPEFAAMREKSLARRKAPKLKHILITMGGVDKGNVTSDVLAGLRGCDVPADCRISVVMGPHAPWLEDVRQTAATMPWQTDVLLNVKDMARLMMESDLAIGAAGSTSWERCCLGLPTFLMAVAENQKISCRSLSALGACRVLPTDADLPRVLQKEISELTKSNAQLINLSQRAANVCDGEGVTRISAELVQ